MCFRCFFYSLPIKYFPSSFPRTSLISPRLPLATVSGRNNEFLIGGGGGKRETLRQRDLLNNLIITKPHFREREPLRGTTQHRAGTDRGD